MLRLVAANNRLGERSGVAMIDLNQSWPLPDRPLPIVIFGAGSIVTDGPIPAYLPRDL